MNYKETLFFVAKCLTINHEEHNKIIVENLLKSNAVDWDAVVKLSTAHYVFPALYCNLKRASFLSYLPEELVEYMKYITDLNRDRNKEIIEQAKQLNELLLQNKITPIFLKGTGNLLEGLYEDIGERMVGDIDFIVSNKEYKNTTDILIKNNFSPEHDSVYNNLKIGKHFPRMSHENKIAAVEVHFRIVKNPYDYYLNYKNLKKDLIETEDDILMLSYKNQLLHNIYNIQINDSAYYKKTILLRNSYDLFLLSKKTDTLETILTNKKYFNILNSFLVTCYYLFNQVSSIHFKNDNKAKKYIKNTIELLDSQKKRKLNIIKWSFYLKKMKIISGVYTKIRFAFINKNVRIHLFNKIFRG